MAGSRNSKTGETGPQHSKEAGSEMWSRVATVITEIKQICFSIERERERRVLFVAKLQYDIYIYRQHYHHKEIPKGIEK